MQDNAFLTSFPNNSIKIHQLHQKHSDIFKIEILDDHGDTIEEATSDDVARRSQCGFDRANDQLKDLFQAARRHANGADSAYDTILTLLQENNPGCI